MGIIVRLQEGCIEGDKELMLQSGLHFQAISIEQNISKFDLVNRLHQLAENIQYDEGFE